MRACVRLDNRTVSVRFAVEYGLCQESMVEPLLFSVFFASFMNVACTHFEAEKDIMMLNTHTFICTYVAPQIPPVRTSNATVDVVREQITFPSYL